MRYSILRPGGNDTALVFGIEKNLEKRKQINNEIMSQNPNVEQVGFVNLDKSSPELMMAGEEFCGNATRSTAWLVLDGKLGEIKIKVSGVNSKLNAGVDNQGNAWAQMPIFPEKDKVKSNPNGSSVVSMEGITHVVVQDIYTEKNPEELKRIAFSILQKEGLDNSVAAAGVMFISKSDKGIKLRPVVWVRDIQTLFYESACGSGTTAVGLLEAQKENGSVSLSVIQPSGMPIKIDVDFNGVEYVQARISGPVEVISLNNTVSR